ncbi:MAG: hypothetical protein AAFN10_15890, partial [Bacteroidota bacterium]
AFLSYAKGLIMRRQILWAKRKPKQAFQLLVGINIVLFTIAFFLGLLFGPIDRTAFYIGQLVIGSIMVLTYFLHHYYKFRRTGPIPDSLITGFRLRVLTLNLCIFGLFVLNGSDLVSPVFEAPAVKQSIAQSAAARSLDNDPANQFKRLEQLALSVRNRVKKNFKSPFDGLNDTARLILSIVFIVAAAALLVFAIAYACALACTEMAAVAGILMIGGLVMILFGFPLIFTRIWGLRRGARPGWGKLFGLALIGIPLIFGVGLSLFGSSVLLGSIVVIAMAVGMSFIARSIRSKQLVEPEEDLRDSGVERQP